ncbi:DNA topoisomerase III [Acidilutibacter cellobiosedens]|uniref:DNA topoisomerase n=1 Tax=Acidilutibacter cellobiosedens TaxID=2507161 RepID=A0A410Q8H9_9FIRM|nr:DNA topoisomerase 3 [Acidilutibacter cellobiosedens]QAT60281.1 DNA topoisomerase III [Acidilutibacter cellobiosedens]
MKLVIAEKPSVAMSIAKVIGANSRKDGYLEGNNYIVSWCVGHLIRMSSPESYDGRYKRWSIADLPIFPDNYKYEVSKYTKKQYSILKKLFADKRVVEVVNACDAGREGELIFRLVYNQARCKKPIKRLWISSMEDKAIKEGFNNLKDGIEYENLYRSALARGQADWLVGMNLSRYYSCLHNNNYSVGRVQTPTLSMVVDRDKSIRNFEKEKYFTVQIDANNMKLETSRIDEKEKADKLLSSIPGIIEIKEIEKKRKITRPDRLFDLTTLQRECNKYFGYSAKQTLDYAQSLYEKKLITYPRTDSRFLTDDMVDNVKRYVDSFGNDFDGKNFKSIFDSKKVTDHTAIIPTSASLDFDTTSLQGSEEKVFELIKVKLLAARSENLITENTKIICNVEGYEFTTTGTVVIDEGYTKYLTSYTKKKEDKVLPKLDKGDKLKVESKKINEKYTNPPKHYTEDTLLKAMELAGSEARQDMELERKGLGTPATRAGILENLINKELIKRDERKLISTEKGEQLVSLVADFLRNPNTTVDWEVKLYEISEGKADLKDFIGDVEKRIREVISQK